MIMIVDQRNAELIGSAYECLSVDVQEGCQYFEAHAGDRLLPDQPVL